MPHSHISIMFNFTLYVCAQNFHIMNIHVPASVVAPPLSHQQMPLITVTQLHCPITFYHCLLHCHTNKCPSSLYHSYIVLSHSTTVCYIVTPTNAPHHCHTVTLSQWRSQSSAITWALGGRKATTFYRGVWGHAPPEIFFQF